MEERKFRKKVVGLLVAVALLLAGLGVELAVLLNSVEVTVEYVEESDE